MVRFWTQGLEVELRWLGFGFEIGIWTRGLGFGLRSWGWTQVVGGWTLGLGLDSEIVDGIQGSWVELG